MKGKGGKVEFIILKATGLTPANPAKTIWNREVLLDGRQTLNLAIGPQVYFIEVLSHKVGKLWAKLVYLIQICLVTEAHR
jgi:hypothetical protein